MFVRLFGLFVDKYFILTDIQALCTFSFLVFSFDYNWTLLHHPLIYNTSTSKQQVQRVPPFRTRQKTFSLIKPFHRHRFVQAFYRSEKVYAFNNILPSPLLATGDATWTSKYRCCLLLDVGHMYNHFPYPPGLHFRHASSTSRSF